MACGCEIFWPTGRRGRRRTFPIFAASCQVRPTRSTKRSETDNGGRAVTKGRWLLIVLIAALVAAYFVFGLGQYFSLGYLKSQQAAIDGYYSSHPLQTVAVFFVVYVAV